MFSSLPEKMITFSKSSNVDKICQKLLSLYPDVNETDKGTLLLVQNLLTKQVDIKVVGVDFPFKIRKLCGTFC
jgi:hypothetical protein